MHWFALIPPACPRLEPGEGAEVAPGGDVQVPGGGPTDVASGRLVPPGVPDPRLPLGWWALQFTPRVCLLEEAVLMELRASLRLFGGEPALRERLRRESAELGVAALAWAPTRLAALALARCGRSDGFAQPLPLLLDALPLAVLSAVAEHGAVLSRLGCRTLGELRRLPRGGLSRRFGAPLLRALDQAYGTEPEAPAWLALPEVFDVRLELPGRVETAAALMFGARRLLLQLAGWLAARRMGVRALRLVWRHEGRRGDAPAGELPIRTAAPTRDVEHLGRLIAEHLAQTRLLAPVGELRLRADEVGPLAPASGALAFDVDAALEGEPFQQLVERLSARLGPARVLRPEPRADHRPERRVQWVPQASPAAPPPSRRRSDPAGCPGAGAGPVGMPQPAWLLDVPLPLAVRGDRLHYQGPLRLLAGPHRIEAGWWDGGGPAGPDAARAERDYFVAWSAAAGLLWIYRERRPAGPGGGSWFLHGIYG